MPKVTFIEHNGKEHTVEATRGAAIGFYSMTGGIGNTLAPLALGVVADIFSLVAVFYVSSVLVLIGLVAMCWIWFRMPQPSAVNGQLEGQAYAQGGLKQ